MRACAILFGLMLLAAPSGATEAADEAVTTTPPPQLAPPIPPAPPPTYLPPYAAEPSLAELEALERLGRHKHHVGVTLAGVGAGLAVIGSGLLIAGTWDDGSCYPHYTYDLYSSAIGYIPIHEHHWCGAPALAFAGAASTIVGVGLIIAGASIDASGHNDIAVARHIRRCGWASLSLRPSIGPTGAGLVLAITP